MRIRYSGYYRTRLSKTEKEAFRRKALAEGSIVDVHDSLLREYIGRRKENLQEREHSGEDKE